MAHRFRQGHQIRLTTAGGSFPRWARNLGTDEPLVSATEFVRSTHALDCSGSRPVLPPALAARPLGIASAKTGPAVAICYALALDPSGVVR